MKNAPILVIGSTGKTGSRIARRLEAGGYTVRHGARGAAIPFDWEDAETWGPALAGVRAVYISYFPDLAVPGAAEQVEALVGMARDAGVQKLVLLSGRGEPVAERCEGIVRDSGLDHTLVRAAWFAQNFSEGYLWGPAMAGAIALPAGNVREPIVDVDDIADVAVAALTEDGHSGELYEVTGPRLLSFDEIAAELSRHIGHEVRYRPISFDDFHAGMAADAGTFIADVITDICRQTLDGRNAHVTDGVIRALGRPPRDFADFCRTAAAGGAWKQAA